MRKLIIVIIAFLSSSLAYAQGAEHATLTARFDLDGGAAAATAITGTNQVVDSTNYTVTGQPDTPRPLVVVVTDADASIVACTFTVTGTQANRTLVSATTSMAGGSGNKVLSPNHNFATVTQAGNGVCTGEGGAADTVSVGTSSTLPAEYAISFGAITRNWQGADFKNVFSWKTELRKAKTTGSSVTLTSNTASGGAFTAVVVGDLLLFQDQERVVVTKTDHDNITVYN